MQDSSFTKFSPHTCEGWILDLDLFPGPFWTFASKLFVMSQWLWAWHFQQVNVKTESNIQLEEQEQHISDDLKMCLHLASWHPKTNCHSQHSHCILNPAFWELKSYSMHQHWPDRVLLKKLVFTNSCSRVSIWTTWLTSADKVPSHSQLWCVGHVFVNTCPSWEPTCLNMC